MPEKALANESSTNDFCAEELFIPNSDKSDCNRLNMFTNHVQQMVVLDKPETPEMFTRFENQIGNVSSSYITAKEDFVVLAKIKRNTNRYSLIVQYKESKIVDIINFVTSKNITESYGYLMDIPEYDFWNDGDEIEKGTVLSASSAYDENHNFMYGTNLKTVYYTMHGMTFEDKLCPTAA